MATSRNPTALMEVFISTTWKVIALNPQIGEDKEMGWEKERSALRCGPALGAGGGWWGRGLA